MPTAKKGVMVAIYSDRDLTAGCWSPQKVVSLVRESGPQNGLRNIQVKDLSGQIIATSHDLTPHGRVVG